MLVCGQQYELVRFDNTRILKVVSSPNIPLNTIYFI
jgi:hypothetical protein